MEGWKYTTIEQAEAAEKLVNQNFEFPKESITQKMVSAVKCDDFYFIAYHPTLEKYLGKPETLTNVTKARNE